MRNQATIISRHPEARKRDIIDRIADAVWGDGVEKAAEAIVPILCAAGITWIIVRLIQAVIKGAL